MKTKFIDLKTSSDRARQIYFRLVRTIGFLILSGFSSGIIFPIHASGEPVEKTRRIETSYTFENLDPNADYGNRHSGELAFFIQPLDGFTFFMKGNYYNRMEESASAGTAGAYIDWGDSLYTYSSVSAGRRSVYLPRFRFDHDFNFKFGDKKNIVLTAGITHIDYFTSHEDLILSGGPTLYLNPVILQYRLFHNQSSPGSVVSYSHLLSIGYGEEHWQWTYLVFSFGKQAYLATTFTSPEEINKNSFDVTLRHRHWLNPSYGVFGDVSYFKLEDGYDKAGICMGLFYEF
jgi:YaiO family outer membrane protein